MYMVTIVTSSGAPALTGSGVVTQANANDFTMRLWRADHAPLNVSQAARNGWKVVQTRWIDINKGDDENPNYRSRLVGKEFNNEHMDGLFAGTPPLEALRYLIHAAATVRSGEALGPNVIMINDVARAFFEAPAMGNVSVEIPKEDEAEADAR